MTVTVWTLKIKSVYCTEDEWANAKGMHEQLGYSDTTRGRLANMVATKKNIYPSAAFVTRYRLDCKIACSYPVMISDKTDKSMPMHGFLFLKL